MPGGYYPKASLEVQGVGDLVSITELTLDIDNGAQTEMTMKTAGSGFSHGPVKVDGSFSVKYSTDPEADFVSLVRKKQIVGMTFKLADGTRIPLEAAPSKASYKSQETGADTCSISFSGFTPQTQ